MWTKTLPLRDNQESWMLHSPNAMVGRKAHKFVNCEYRRGLLDFEATIINGSTLKQRDITRKKCDLHVVSENDQDCLNYLSNYFQLNNPMTHFQKTFT